MILVTIRSMAAGLLVAAGLSSFGLDNAPALMALDGIPVTALGPWLKLSAPLVPMALIVAGAVTYMARHSDKTNN